MSQLAPSSSSFFVCLTLHGLWCVPIRLHKLVQLSNRVEILKSFLLGWYVESTHKRSVTTRAAVRKGRAAGRKWFGKGFFHLAAASPAKTELREHA